MLPKSVGRYKILDRIGSGGMAVVYLGRDEMFDRPVAVKVLPTNLGQDPENRERFRREAKAIASLEHAAVVPVYDYGEDGDQLFLVMRYMQGGSLKDRLTHGRVPLAGAAAILRRIASALDKAHSMGMVHRDIKPGNILFDLEDNPYITDFGLVKMVEVSVQLTHSEFFGTPAYTSPEQCQGDKSIDARADVYSLTAMFFHMISGSAPYQSNNAMALLMKHVSDPVPRLADAAPDLPHALQAVIDRGMAKSPADRYPSTGELAKGVDRVVTSPPPDTAPASSIWGAKPAPAGPYSATESGRAVSFEALRPPPKKAAPPAADEVPTRRESIPSGRIPSIPSAAAAEAPLDPEATNAVEFREIPVERRRLEWKPQADAAPPPSEADAAPAPPIPAVQPAQLSYTEPPKPLEKKPAGIPILIFIVVLLIISVLYFAAQKGLF